MRRDIVRVANSFVGIEYTYNIRFFNCEHFAHLCRNKKLICQQLNGVTWLHKALRLPEEAVLLEVVGKAVEEVVFEKIMKALQAP